MKNLIFILLLTPSVFWGQPPIEPPHWADMGLVKKTFVAHYTIPRFQTGENGFQEWIKFELNDYKKIQNLIKKGDLEVSWNGHSQNADIKTSDSTVKKEIERVFKKMPLWYSNFPQWEDVSGKDTIFVDDTKKEFYRFLLPDNPFLFQFRLTDSLSYQYVSKSFSDTIEVTGGRLGFPTQEKLYPIFIFRENLTKRLGHLIKKQVDEHFLLRKSYKLLALKEMDIVIRVVPDVRVYVEATTKRAKRVSKRLEKIIHKKWRSWELDQGQIKIKARLMPNLGIWVYGGREY
jgi:hypothetical protein